MPAKAVIFDFIGTLANVKNYNLGISKMKLYRAIVDAGFNVDIESFSEAYDQAHEKYRIIRYEKLVEVTNAVWISEALNMLGFKTTPEDTRIKTAVNMFFEDYLNSLELRPHVKKMLRELSKNHKLGLVSNFTYAPVIYASLRKLSISQFFSVVQVSEDAGWRKPNTKIFQETLRKLGVNAKETIYVGDSPLEDIKGAKKVGMKTIFISSQFYSLDDLYESKQQPDFIFSDILELYRNFQTSRA
ncbi:MAG: HAD family hydrolase [Candidatus Bathyarchaeota archaeon]|nr:HAD family hydrolase [Candidatus Bathyarchaeota archaeon]